VKRLVVISIAALALLAWAVSQASPDDDQTTRVLVWSADSRPAAGADPSRLVLVDAQVLDERDGRRAVLGTEWTGAGQRASQSARQRTVAIVNENDEVETSERLVSRNGSSSMGLDDALLIFTESEVTSDRVFMEQDVASVRVFRDSGVTEEPVSVDPVSGTQFVLLLGPDVHGHHLLDADGRVVGVST
jgi:hypothetical protein